MGQGQTKDASTSPASGTPVPGAPSNYQIPDLPLDKHNSEDLMLLIQEGDEGAFEELFQRFQGPALSFIYRMIGDRNRTEALGQEAFLRIFKEAKSYQHPRSFPTWFYTIVRNLCKSELRWRSRHPTVSLDEPLQKTGGDGEGRSASLGGQLRAAGVEPVDVLTGEELHRRLEQALEKLPDLDREILILKRFQGLKYKEISEVLDVPLGTVRTRIQAALDALRKEVKEYL